MGENVVEHIVRYTRLREELKPVKIYPADTLEPIRPDWVAITHGIVTSDRLVAPGEGFNIAFLTDNGQHLAFMQFETLEIAIDQAHAIAGIRHGEWTACHVEVTDDEGRIPWSLVAQQRHSVDGTPHL